MSAAGCGTAAAAAAAPASAAVAAAALVALLLCCCPAAASLDREKAHSAELVKERIKALYMNMDAPEISPGDTTGALNVSLTVSQLLRFRDHQLELSFTLDMRWRHKFLEMLDDTMEAIPLDRDRLWTPKFVFVNVRSIREDQSSLYLQLTAGQQQSKAIVYRVWHRASISCEGPSIQHPFSDSLCSLVFEEANPHSSRSVHMTLTHWHQTHCTRQESLGRSFMYRISKPFTHDGRKFQFWTRICIRTNLEEMTPALRQYCVSLILVLFSLSTVYFFDKNTRLFVNLALLHILIFNWAPLGSRINAVDIWNAKCTFIVCCCLLVSLATVGRGGGGGGGGGRRGNAGNQDSQDRRHGRCSHNGTFLLQKDFSGGGGARTSKCTTISESTDHLDLFDTRRSPASDAGSQGSSSVWRLVVKVVLPLWWLAFVAAFWATILLTSARCESLLPECFLS